MFNTEIANRYNRIAGAHKYIVGFIRHGVVYYVQLDFAGLCGLLKDDRASSKRGGTLKLRVRVSSEQAIRFINRGEAVALCKVEELDDGKYNKGENFERIITETLTSELWVKDSVPFYVKGDINVNGEEIQIKLDGAELTNEKTLARAEALVGA
jgi:hypothetical protein